MTRTTKEGSAFVADRRTRALQMRVAGADDVAIGRALRAPDPDDSSFEGFLGGYNPKASDDTRANAVRQDVVRALKARRTQQGDATDDYKAMQRTRLERLYLASSTAAHQGDAASVRNCVRIISELCKLDGLYAPVRIEATVTDEESREIRDAVEQLIGEVTAGASLVDPDSADSI